jgi:hypothetical protein
VNCGAPGAQTLNPILDLSFTIMRVQKGPESGWGRSVDPDVPPGTSTAMQAGGKDVSESSGASGVHSCARKVLKIELRSKSRTCTAADSLQWSWNICKLNPVVCRRLTASRAGRGARTLTNGRLVLRVMGEVGRC